MLLTGKSLTLGPLRIEVTRHDEQGIQATLTLTLSSAEPKPAKSVEFIAKPLSLLEPDYDPATGRLVFRTEGGDGTVVEFMAIGVTDWTAKPVQTLDEGVRTDPAAEPIKILARQSGVTIDRLFDFHVSDKPVIVPASPANTTVLVQEIFRPQNVIRSNPDIMNLVQEWKDGKARLVDTARPELQPGERAMYFMSGSEAVDRLPDGYVFEPGDEVVIYKAIGRNADVYQDEWNRKSDWTIKFTEPHATTGN